MGIVKGIAHAKIRWWKKPLLMLDAIYSMHRKFNLRSELMHGCRDYLRTLPCRQAKSQAK